MSDEATISASPEDLIRAALAHEVQIQALMAQVAVLMARLEAVTREATARTSALEQSTSDATTRTRAEFETPLPFSRQMSRPSPLQDKDRHGSRSVLRPSMRKSKIRTIGSLSWNSSLKPLAICKIPNQESPSWPPFFKAML